MSKLFLLLTFSTITPFLLIFSLVFYSFLLYQKNPTLLYSHAASTQSISYGALPTLDELFTQDIGEKEAKTEIIRQFFAKYNSPLEPYAQKIVDEADKYGLDQRLLPAIAMQESNLCKKAPENSYNCWGFGIYGGKVTRFSDFNEAIETVTRTLALKYKDKHGLATPEQIVRLYTPSDEGKWTYAVNHFMAKLE